MVRGSAFVLVLVPLLFGADDALASPLDASAGDGGTVCASIGTEDACVETAGCAWGDQGKGAACFSVGAPAEAQPGSGDPGGGGSGVVRADESGDGCSVTSSSATRSGSAGALAMAVAAIWARRRRRRAGA